ncbi:MAG: UDP-N-acetylmuramoyl-L-alanine--D-glutamate ligase [Candidatus Portnoybacteria bacterium CG10_big_fil_rev_8_21_14_0_10_36_7]|uniref:UDP-N-acetylmuramoyl-L-alanine--D-glutamate ligase n=1 Tax=Candidatus Portnoybacteria bacterium CG10_big_fil_rev_8_21_14_0_10_36_7 TaxID=1974812 RepID=A0A2M8KDP1_9BACT|nr:MAG: UDP-N-acetylmuramoyl-L-alanine--D-glutamate ligase [Candidatus Portnoybacteria bacterium CG10_big_fil_rev_8_21_14_0_10_36_7]
MKQKIKPKQPRYFFSGKKILLVGLGRLGGGLAMAKFLILHKAKLTITDMLLPSELKDGLKKLKGQKIKFTLGEHKAEDFLKADYIIFNQAVSIYSKWPKFIIKNKKKYFNNLTLFLELTKNTTRPVIAVTGTRGKTTITTWLSHFIPQPITGGNTPNSDLFKIIDQSAPNNSPFIIEMPSHQLEYIKKGLAPPHIAVITNLYEDHLDRYGDMKTYRAVKKRIFLNQTKKDFLVLNNDNKNTKIFLSKKPKSQLYFFSLTKLPLNKDGLFFENDSLYMQNQKKRVLVTKLNNFTPHQRQNLLASLLTAYLFGRSWKDLIQKINALPAVPFRQQIIYQTDSLTIINDSAATSPDATIAGITSMKKFGNNLLLITGGTDKKLGYKNLAKKIASSLKGKNIFFLNGSATDKLLNELKKIKYFRYQPQVFSNLKDILFAVKQKKMPKKAILFSPGGSSFEKFKNEFDRGEQFNKLSIKIFG